MNQIPIGANRSRKQLMELVQAEMGRDFAVELRHAQIREMCQAEGVAVVDHGQQILAMIEGRNYVGPGEVADYASSRLVSLMRDEGAS